MSMEVILRQKGLFKKVLPLEVILGKQLTCGSYDAYYRMDPGIRRGEDFIIYDPGCPGRGISVVYDEKHKPNLIRLQLLIPSPRREVHAFFQCVARITDFWNCTLEVDGEKLSSEEFQRRLTEDLVFHRDTLKSMSLDILGERSGDLTLFSAIWPMVMGQEEAEQFAQGDLDAFGGWLCKGQLLDAHYTAPRFYQKDGKIVGVYTMVQDTLTILPRHGSVPYGATQSDTGEPLECRSYDVGLISPARKSPVGRIPLERFLRLVPPEMVSRYDGDHVLIRPLSLSQMLAIKQRSEQEDAL